MGGPGMPGQVHLRTEQLRALPTLVIAYSIVVHHQVNSELIRVFELLATLRAEKGRFRLLCRLVPTPDMSGQLALRAERYPAPVAPVLFPHDAVGILQMQFERAFIKELHLAIGAVEPPLFVDLPHMLYERLRFGVDLLAKVAPVDFAGGVKLARVPL